MHLNDQDLIAETRAGSYAAFDQLIRRHEKLVFRVAYSYVHQPDPAYDIAQNVFLKVFRKLGSFSGQSTFRSWLTRIAQNESVNWIRDQRRHQEHDELTPANTPSSPPVQELRLLEQERDAALREEIHQLNAKQSRAVLLRYYEKMSIREISTVLECSEGQVKSLLFRGVSALRERLPRRAAWDQEMGA